MGGCLAVRHAAGTPALERDATLPGRRLSYGLHLAPQPNLIYQLDCIAGVIVCARPIYRELWSSLGLSADDEATLATWKSLRSRYGGELRRSDRPAPVLPLLVASDLSDLGERQRIAGLVSRTPEAYEAALALLSTNSDARQLRALLARFAPRFDEWWRTRGLAAGSSSFDGIARLLADPFLDSVLERAARFYQADLPPGPALELYLMVQPASRRKLAIATQLEGYAAVELPEAARPTAQIDVLAHELFHYFFSRMQPEAKAAMLGRIAASEDPLAAASFGVLDEAVAAALGNGLVGRHYSPPEVFAQRLARDDGLDKYQAASLTARALLPSLERFLDGGTALASSEFLRTYLEAAHVMYKAGQPRPIDYLHSHISVAAPRFAIAAQRLQDATNAGFPYLRQYGTWNTESKAFVTDHPLESAAIFVSADERPDAVIEALGADRKDCSVVSAAAARGRGLIYALRRTPKSFTFVLIARDPAAMDELVTRFVSLSAVRDGLLLELPSQRD